MLALNSCYSAKMYVGDVQPNTPTVEVNSVKNHYFIYGLAKGGNTSVDIEKYMGERKNYVVGRKATFVDGLLSSITFGIYTPTTTTFYVPLKDLEINAKQDSIQVED